MFKTVVRNLDHFFFRFEPGSAASAFRVLFCLTLFLNATLRAFHWDFYFTPVGGVPWEGALELLPEYYRPPFAIYPKSNLAIGVYQALLLGSLLALILGLGGRIWGRVLALVAYVSHLALMQRNFSIVYGADIVSSFWLFGLLFMSPAPSNKAGGRAEPLWSKTLTSVGARLVQIQLCIIYGYTGFEKLKGTEWWDQSAVWNVLGNEQLMMADLSFLKATPLVIAALTWGTILFEVYMPALVWPQATRRWVLWAGVGLHLGIAAIMGLFFFSATMLSAYVIFLEPATIDRVLGRLRLGRLRTLKA